MKIIKNPDQELVQEIEQRKKEQAEYKEERERTPEEVEEERERNEQLDKEIEAAMFAPKKRTVKF